MTLTKKDKAEMLHYLGFEVDEHDWKSIKEMIDQVKSDKPKYDILYWSNKNKQGYIVRANKIEK
jgi:hypothetical protein